jgi:hypothetical protein
MNHEPGSDGGLIHPRMVLIFVVHQFFSLKIRKISIFLFRNSLDKIVNAVRKINQTKIYLRQISFYFPLVLSYNFVSP